MSQGRTGVSLSSAITGVAEFSEWKKDGCGEGWISEGSPNNLLLLLGSQIKEVSVEDHGVTV